MFSLTKLGSAVRGLVARSKLAMTPKLPAIPPADLFAGQHTNARKNAWRKLKRQIGARQARRRLLAFRRMAG